MDLERARGQHAHLLHQLLAVVALRLHNLLEQSQLGQLLLPVDNFTAPPQHVGRRINRPIRPAVFTRSRCIDKNADVTIPDHFAGGFIQKHVQIVAQQVNIKQLFGDRIAHVLQPDWLTGQHAGQ